MFVTAIDPSKIGGTNVAAFLRMLAVSEGTDDGKQATHCNGYDVLVGGAVIDDLSKHPARLVKLNSRLSSTAAGRYQFLRRTWDDLVLQVKLSDFGPESQDRAATKMLQWCGAYELIRAGEFAKAVHAARKLWASLPGAGYDQHEQKIEKLQAAYIEAGGKIGVPA